MVRRRKASTVRGAGFCGRDVLAWARPQRLVPQALAWAGKVLAWAAKVLVWGRKELQPVPQAAPRHRRGGQ
eukprot:10699906-Alexandrium_andersonii.AAC.1